MCTYNLTFQLNVFTCDISDVLSRTQSSSLSHSTQDQADILTQDPDGHNSENQRYVATESSQSSNVVKPSQVQFLPSSRSNIGVDTGDNLIGMELAATSNLVAAATERSINAETIGVYFIIKETISYLNAKLFTQVSLYLNAKLYNLNT